MKVGVRSLRLKLKLNCNWDPDPLQKVIKHGMISVTLPALSPMSFGNDRAKGVWEIGLGMCSVELKDSLIARNVLIS